MGIQLDKLDKKIAPLPIRWYIKLKELLKKSDFFVNEMLERLRISLISQCFYVV